MSADEVAALRENFSVALDHRTIIAAAMGIIVADRACNLDEAFSVLQAVSSHRNQKLYDIAREMVDERSARRRRLSESAVPVAKRPARNGDQNRPL